MAMGRPREFDVDQALDKALAVFWRKGYEGTSLSDLTEALGVNRPSLYAAFGNKEELFRKALDRYADDRTVALHEALDAPTARAVFERLLRGTADFLTERGNPRGCLMVQGAQACSDEAEPVRRALVERRAEAQAMIRRRFQRAKDEGDLPAGLDPADLARYVYTLLEGFAVRAAAGNSRRELHRVVDLALRIWPD